MRKRVGFTLAEVLITLGIIGVVAAITIPTLMSNSQDAQFTSSLKKFYSDLSQAMVTMQESDTQYTIPTGDTNANESIAMRDNLCGILSCIRKDTTLKIFGTDIYHGAVGNTVYKNYKSSDKVYTDLQADYASAVLKNGMFIGLSTNIESRKGFQLYVDTNGAKGPNMFGKDLNMFEILHDDNNYYKTIVSGAPETYVYTQTHAIECKTGMSSYGNVWPCSYYRLYKPEELP